MDDKSKQNQGDFLSPGLAPGEIQSIHWRDTGASVSKNSHVIGLKPSIRESLLKYCNNMGITHVLRELTCPKVQLGEEAQQHRLQGKDWFVQRSPDAAHWDSNMHWISPYNDKAYQHFLRALGEAGFDEILQSVGRHFGFEGLTAYHLSVIAVSKCSHGNIHVDATNTGAKVVNVIIPLILAGDTGPELRLGDDELVNHAGEQKVGYFRYQYDVAAIVGDDAYHGTSAVNYSESDEMRMAATVYLGDITAENVHAAMDDYITYPNQYPPPNQPEMLLQSAGSHWQRNDPSKKLPALYGESPIL